MDLVVRGATENNLRDVDLELPLGGLVVFTGPSGSGKSSLAFDTLHAEGQRRYVEAASAQRSRPARLLAPHVDEVRGLPPTVALDQRAEAPPAAATVAQVGGVLAPLRLLFGRAGTQHCPDCGRAVQPLTQDEIVARMLSGTAGERLLIEAPVRRRGATSTRGLIDAIARAGFSRLRLGGEVVRIDAVPTAIGEDMGEIRIVVDRLRVDPARTDRMHDAVRTASRAGVGEIVIVRDGGEERLVDRPYCPHDDRLFAALEPRLLDPRSALGRCARCDGRGLVDGNPCPACDGLGLDDVARSVRFEGLVLADVLGATVDAARAQAASWPANAVTERPVADWMERLGRLDGLGLGYLPLSRRAADLSSGELQRLRLSRQLGGRLSGVLYVLDEPAAGLGDEAAAGVVSALRALVAAGNTVLAVSHHPVVIDAGDRVVDFGPGAGVEGGRILFEGSPAALREMDTATGRWLSARDVLPPAAGRTPSGWIVASGATSGNLAGDDVRLPVGAMAAIVGPSGSGKSRLLDTLVAHLRPEPPDVLPPLLRLTGNPGFVRVVGVSRRSVGRTARSNVATFTGLWTVLRDLLSRTAEARIRGLEPAAFSLNVRGGRCETCRGTGVQRVDLQWLADVYLTCPVCRGRRFTTDVLQVRWKGLAADELLAMSVADAWPHLAGHPDLEARLRAIHDVGLGYMALGQAGYTWSGGEAQRLLLARELARANRRGAEGALYVLDDPTVGLHPADVAVLRAVLDQLVQDGATVWLATHDCALAASCDAVVRLGPGSGPGGGRVISD